MTTARLGLEQRTRRRRTGFTLVEIMLVVVILGILASVAVVNLGGRTKRASIAATRLTIQSTGDAIRHFEVDNGAYPDSLDQLLNDTGQPTWQGPYLEKRLPLDAWGVGLSYSKSENSFVISSSGPDKQFGSADDITN